MAHYPDTMTLPDARALFFERAHLGADGGYGARWVRVETKPLPVYFPNTHCRVEAAKLHDFHHVATEYGTDWPGEAEIAAWEIGGGCGRHGWAWLLNLGAFTVGLLLVPRRLWRAFLYGRRAANLYHTGFAGERLEGVTVGALRARLGVTAVLPRTRRSDIVAFAGWTAVGILWHAGIAVAGITLAWWLVKVTCLV